MSIRRASLPHNRDESRARQIARLHRRIQILEGNPFIRNTSDIAIHGEHISGGDGTSAGGRSDIGVTGHTMFVAPNPTDTALTNVMQSDPTNKNAYLNHIVQNDTNSGGNALIQHGANGGQSSGSGSIEHSATGASASIVHSSVASNGGSSIEHSAVSNGSATVQHNAIAQESTSIVHDSIASDGAATIAHTAEGSASSSITHLSTSADGPASIEHQAIGGTNSPASTQHNTIADGASANHQVYVLGGNGNGSIQLTASGSWTPVPTLVENDTMSDTMTESATVVIDIDAQQNAVTITAETLIVDGNISTQDDLVIGDNTLSSDDDGNLTIEGNLLVTGTITANVGEGLSENNSSDVLAEAASSAQEPVSGPATQKMGRASFVGNGTRRVRLDIVHPTGVADTNFVASPRGVWAGEIHADGLIDDGERLSLQATSTGGIFANGQEYQFSYMAGA